MYHVYVLANSESKIYIGCTKDIERRISEHNRGNSGFTRSKGSWKIIYTEKFEHLPEALKREKSLKSSRGRAWIKKEFLKRVLQS